MVEYLKYLKEYLKHDREKYGVAPFGLDFSFDSKTFYGMVEDDLGISDNNSFFLLYDFNKRYLSKPMFKPAMDLGNMNDYYDDLLHYMHSFDLEELDNLGLLNEEQRRFYEAFLGSNPTTSITSTGIVVGESARGRAYIYTNKDEINS